MNTFSASYYIRNRQDGDRPALWFYARLVRRWLIPGPVLDFGCGTGFLLRRLHPHMPVAGLELSAYCRDLLSRELPCVRIYEELASLPDDFFAGIVALHVFEHIPDDTLRVTLKKLLASLRSDGRLLCVMPDAAGRGRRLKGERWSGFGDPTHVNLKSAQEWHEFFERAGFRVLRCGSDGLWDFPYSKGGVVWFDYLRFAWGTVFQFLLGYLILPAGSGESAIFLLQRDADRNGAD